MTNETRRSLAYAGLVFALVGPTAYLAQRIFERSRGPEPSPTLIIRGIHTALYWRMANATWIAAVAALAVYAVVRRPVVSAKDLVGFSLLGVIWALVAWQYP